MVVASCGCCLLWLLPLVVVASCGCCLLFHSSPVAEFHCFLLLCFFVSCCYMLLVSSGWFFSLFSRTHLFTGVVFVPFCLTLLHLVSRKQVHAPVAGVHHKFLLPRKFFPRTAITNSLPRDKPTHYWHARDVMCGALFVPVMSASIFMVVSSICFGQKLPSQVSVLCACGAHLSTCRPEAHWSHGLTSPAWRHWANHLHQ